MGCDIHPYVEFREVESYTRNDELIRNLQRLAATGDLDASAKLTEYEVLGPWRFGAGTQYLYDPDDLEAEFGDENGNLNDYGKVVVQLQSLWENLASEGAQKTMNTWSATWSVKEGLEPFPKGRNYSVFGWLTGTVRGGNDGASIVDEPRGIPDDLSEIVRLNFDLERPDAHSRGWLFAEEIAESKHESGYSHHRESFDQYREVMAAWVEAYGKERVRLVFWFDN